MLRQIPDNATFNIECVSMSYTSTKKILQEYSDGNGDLTLLPTVVEFCEMWNVPFNDIVDIARSKDIFCKMFDVVYVVTGETVKNGVLIASNYFSTPTVAGFDAYIVEAENVKKFLCELVPEVIKKYYGWLYSESKVRKFSEYLPELSLDATVDFYANNIAFRELTLRDLILLMEMPSYRDSMTTVVDFEWSIDEIYFNVGEFVDWCGTKRNHRLVIPAEAIVKKDISIAGKRCMYYHDNDGQIQWGKQNATGYWKNKKTKIIKKKFKE